MASNIWASSDIFLSVSYFLLWTPLKIRSSKIKTKHTNITLQKLAPAACDFLQIFVQFSKLLHHSSMWNVFHQTVAWSSSWWPGQPGQKVRWRGETGWRRFWTGSEDSWGGRCCEPESRQGWRHWRRHSSWQWWDLLFHPPCEQKVTDQALCGGRSS